jgi:hypothetical protein
MPTLMTSGIKAKAKTMATLARRSLANTRTGGLDRSW